MEALEIIVGLMKAKDPRVRLEAARYVTDRAWGRPTEKIAGDELENPVTIMTYSQEQIVALAAVVARARVREEPEG